jgi:hypothetical protein
MAVALDKFVIPLKLGEDPYGFIGRLQACSFNDENIEASCLKIIGVIRGKASLRESLKDCLFRSLENARNFDGANVIIEELKKFQTFTKKQVNHVIRISIKNNQVRMCREGQDFLKSITKKYGSEIDPALMEIYEKIKDSFESFR